VLLWFLWFSFLWWQASSTVWALAVLNELFLGPVSKAVTYVAFYRGVVQAQQLLHCPLSMSFSVTQAASRRCTSLFTSCQGQIGCKRPFPVSYLRSRRCRATLRRRVFTSRGEGYIFCRMSTYLSALMYLWEREGWTLRSRLTARLKDSRLSRSGFGISISFFTRKMKARTESRC
jgi:hypothetical protein